MELFYSRDIAGGICRLDQDESGHCIKVLRHRSGDEINVIDGCGTLHRCRITSDSHKGVEAIVLESTDGWGSHPYRLHMAVCPTKNNDRYEWFVEKACEIGVDEISPVIGEHSERKIFKTARAEKILVSAAKQSLKASVPVVNEPVSVNEPTCSADGLAVYDTMQYIKSPITIILFLCFQNFREMALEAVQFNWQRVLLKNTLNRSILKLRQET